MSAWPHFTFVTPLAIIVGAGIAWAGNYQVQKRIHQYLRLAHGVDDLKRRLHDFVDLAARYWTMDGPRGEKHRTLEAQILARKRILQEEFNALSSRSTQLKRSHLQTKGTRLDLWNAATGGCFQQAKWVADPQRVVKVAAEATRIIRSLNETH